MAWGQGTSVADADAYGGNQGTGAVDAAGGMEFGGAAAAAELAGAIADAIDAGQASGGTAGTAASEDVGRADAEGSEGYYDANPYESDASAGSAAIDAKEAYMAANPVSAPTASPTVSPTTGFQTHEQMYPGHRQMAKQSGAGGFWGLLSGKNKSFVGNNKAQMIAMGITPSHRNNAGQLTGKYSSGDWKAFQNALAQGGTMATEEQDSGIAGESGATQGQGGVSMGADYGGLITQGQPSPQFSSDYAYGPTGTMATEEFDSPTPLAGTPSQVAMGTGHADPNRVTMEEFQMGMAAPMGSGGSPYVDDFSAYGQQVQPGMSSQEVLGSGFAPSQDFLSPGEQGRVDAAGQFNFAGPQMTAPGQSTSPFSSDYAPGQSASTFSSDYAMGPTPVDAGEFAGTGPGTADPRDLEAIPEGMPPTGPDIGIEMDEGTLDPNAEGVGMISAGTVETEDPVGEATFETNIAGAPVTASRPDAGIEAKAAAVVKEVTENEQLYGTDEYLALAQDRLAVLDRLRANPNGTTHGINNQTLANAYAGFDSTLKAYAAVNGTSKFGQFVMSIIPGLNLVSAGVKGFEDVLINRGIFDRTSGEDILKEIAAKIESGDPLTGGAEPDMPGAITQDDIQAFIVKYPWAKNLDSDYIKLLMTDKNELNSIIGGA